MAKPKTPKPPAEAATTTLVEEFVSDIPIDVTSPMAEVDLSETAAPVIAEPPLVKVAIPGNAVDVILPEPEAHEIKSILPEVVIKKRQIWSDPPGAWVDAE